MLNFFPDSIAVYWDEITCDSPPEAAAVIEDILVRQYSKKNRHYHNLNHLEELFEQMGCSDCHVPELAGVPAYTDLLLHDIAPTGTVLVNIDPAVLPGEFRTPPLWGIGETPPYLHDGSVSDLAGGLIDANPSDEHGTTSHLSDDELADRTSLTASGEITKGAHGRPPGISTTTDHRTGRHHRLDPIAPVSDLHRHRDDVSRRFRRRV